jgi:hypothetical protein
MTGTTVIFSALLMSGAVLGRIAGRSAADRANGVRED